MRCVPLDLIFGNEIDRVAVVGDERRMHGLGVKAPCDGQTQIV